MSSKKKSYEETTDIFTGYSEQLVINPPPRFAQEV